MLMQNSCRILILKGGHSYAFKFHCMQIEKHVFVVMLTFSTILWEESPVSIFQHSDFWVTNLIYFVPTLTVTVNRSNLKRFY